MADQESDFADISNGAARKVQQRSLRRAIAVNAVVMARTCLMLTDTKNHSPNRTLT